MNAPCIIRAAAVLAAVALGAGVPTFAADPHQHAVGAPTELVLDRGKKWATDEPLRKNMSDGSARHSPRFWLSWEKPKPKGNWCKSGMRRHGAGVSR